MEKPTSEDTAERSADETKESIDASRCAAARRRYSLREKRRQYGLLETVPEKKGGAANVQ